MPTVLHIKNMVCPRCIETVDGVFSAMDFEVRDIKLGKVEINKEPTGKQLQELSELLLEKGFELLIDKKSKIINQVKAEVVHLIHHNQNEILPINLSEHLSKRIGTDYSTISNLFSSEEGVTIEKFVILQKVEKVKELLSYGELTLSEIAFKMGYSSAAYLSSQFRKTTGMSPGQYKKLKEKDRNSLDQLGK